MTEINSDLKKRFNIYNYCTEALMIVNKILEDDFKLLNYEKFNNLEDFNNFFLK